MDVVMPQLGETVTEGTVTKWYKKVGDAIRADEALFDVETDKVSTEIPAPASGVLAEILVEEGVTAKVGARLAVIRESGASASTPTPVAAGKPAVAAAPEAVRGAPSGVSRTDTAQRLSPVVRKLIAQHGLNPAQITGSGRDGRITREDVAAFITGRESTSKTVDAAARAPASAAESTRVTLNSVRRRVAENMLRSWTTAPHVLQVVEADFHRVDEARRTTGAQWKQREG